MILVDTAVWIAHFRNPSPTLPNLLEGRAVLTHPFILGEIAMGSLKDRQQTLQELARLPQVVTATNAEVSAFIEWGKLFSLGLSYIDAHLLTSTRIHDGARLWTTDKELRKQAARFEVLFDPQDQL